MAIQWSYQAIIRKHQGTQNDYVIKKHTPVFDGAKVRVKRIAELKEGHLVTVLKFTHGWRLIEFEDTVTGSMLCGYVRPKYLK